MVDPVTLQWSIMKRAQTRSTQYNRKDVVRVLEDLQMIYSEDGMIITTWSTIERTFAIHRRREVERRLRAVHKNVTYLFTVV